MNKFLYSAIFFFLSIISNQQYIEKSIVIVVPSFNNKDWYLRNLNSIFSQCYSNFRVIYIDDCSDDGTANLVEEYIAQNGYQDKCTIIKNKNRYGPLYNRFSAVHSCADDEIIVLVDGDDWLAHDKVLSYLNELYTQESIYMTVGNACKSSTGKKIGHRDYTEDEWDIFGIRQLGFRGVHPRTFYAWLFKKIKVEDFFEDENMYQMATDVACLLPMFEMAQGHYKYIKDILYVYNDENILNMSRNGFKTQIYCDMMIRNKPSYQKIAPDSVGSLIGNKRLDLGGLLFLGKQEDTYPFVEYCKAKKLIFDTVIAIGGHDFKSEMLTPISRLLEFLNLGCDLQTIYTLRINIKDRIHSLIQKMNSNYVVIMAEEFLNNTTIDFEKMCAALENTQAHSMILGRNPSPLVQSYYKYHTDQNYTISLARPWMFSQSFNSKEGCIGLIIRKDALLKMLDSATVFYPNFYTFLAAWHSLIPSNSVLLMSFFDN